MNRPSGDDRSHYYAIENRYCEWRVTWKCLKTGSARSSVCISALRLFCLCLSQTTRCTQTYRRTVRTWWEEWDSGEKGIGWGMNGESAFLNESNVLLSMCLPCMPPPSLPISHSIHFLPPYLPQPLQPHPPHPHTSLPYPAPQHVHEDREIGPLCEECCRPPLAPPGAWRGDWIMSPIDADAKQMLAFYILLWSNVVAANIAQSMQIV